jgi:transcriptional regulator with XRE-family HTH domain
MIFPAQCRAARALLDWSQQALADSAKVGVVTVRQFERGGSAPRNSTLDVIQRAFEAAGVEFIPENGGGAGLRLKARSTHAELTKRIDAIDAHLDADVPETSPSPARGMQMLDRGHKIEVSKKLKQKRAKLEGDR